MNLKFIFSIVSILFLFSLFCESLCLRDFRFGHLSISSFKKKSSSRCTINQIFHNRLANGADNISRKDNSKSEGIIHKSRDILRKILFSISLVAITNLPQEADAVIAPLADVGIKEFLVKDGRQFLRLSIPLGQNGHFERTAITDELKLAQDNLELVRLRFEQVGFTNPSAWGNALKDANTATNIIKSERQALLSGSKEKQSERERIFDDVLIPNLSTLSESIRAKDIDQTLNSEEAAAEALGKLRSLQLPAHELPFKIPDEFSALPRLAGRATIEMTIESQSGIRLENGKTIKSFPLTLVVDGYHAPLTAGNFVDLVNKKFYNNIAIQKVEELTAQTGRPDSGDGYIDPKTKQVRTIPLELFYKSDSEPVYSITSDDDKRATETMVLPFQAYGALGMARGNDDTDSGSSQFFFLKWNQALIAPGRNTLDGFYTCFGYVTNNEPLLAQLKPNDRIVSASVVEGLENLIIP